MLFVQLIIDGLGTGAIYAALGLSLVLVFRCTGVINFAQGEFATLSTFLTYSICQLGVTIWVAVAISMAVSFVVAALAELVIVRPILKQPHLAVILVTIAFYIVANAISQLGWGPTPRTLPAMFPDDVWRIAGVRISAGLVGVLVIEALVVLGLVLFFSRTRMGLAFRAVATSPRESAVVGIRVQRVLMMGWGLAAALGALAGALMTNIGFFVQPDMSSSILVFSLAAMTIGGFDSAGGTIIAGLVLGVLQSLASGFVPGMTSDLGSALALILVLAVLLVRPQGLAGRLLVGQH